MAVDKCWRIVISVSKCWDFLCQTAVIDMWSIILDHSLFIVPLLIIARDWKQPRCLSTEVVKIWCIYTMEYHSAVTKTVIIKYAGRWLELGTIPYVG